MYSGNCYVPLDVKNPIKRIESILEILDPIFIITNHKYIQNIEKCDVKIDILNLDELGSQNVSIENFDLVEQRAKPLTFVRAESRPNLI